MSGEGSYRLTYSFTLAAAHSIPGYPQPRHGHNWEITLGISGDELDGYGFLVDYYDLEEFAGELSERYDHEDLNELPEFSDTPPSAENLASELYDRLEHWLEDYPARAEWIEVAEVPGFTVRYRPD